MISEGKFQLINLTFTISLGLSIMFVLLSPTLPTMNGLLPKQGYFYHTFLPEHSKLTKYSASPGSSSSSSCPHKNNKYNFTFHPSETQRRLSEYFSTKNVNYSSPSSSSSSPQLCYSAPVPPLFDHPEPNYQSTTFHWIGEFFSTFTVIPVAGSLLLATAIRHDYPLILCFLYLHVLSMYCGAFFSHITLIPTAFQTTVTGVVWNSLLAFYFLGDLIPVLISNNSDDKKPLLIAYPWLRRTLAVLGAIGSSLVIQYLPAFIGINGGFVVLSIIQPPFVALGLISTIFMKVSTPFASSKSTGMMMSKYKNCPAVSLTLLSGELLMLAMALSAVECWVDPLLIPITLFGQQFNFPLQHTLIHIVEQIGIYYYGVGAAAMHFYYVEGRGGIDGDVELIQTKKQAKGEFFLLPFVKVHHQQTQKEVLEKTTEKWNNDSSSTKNPKKTTTNKKTDEVEQEDNTPVVDLLSRAFRADPQSFYLSPETNFVNNKNLDVVTAAHENKIKCVFDPELIEAILKNDSDFSSNPFGGDEERYIGLSTTSIQLHAQHVSLIAPFFNDQRLRDLAPVFAEIAQKMAKETFSNKNDKHYNNVVWYAYRVVIANALASFGIDKDEILNDIPNFVDFIVSSSLDMVAAVAPLGGSGTRRRLTPRSLFRIIKSLVKATPSTLSLIFTRLGVSEAWKLLRPDTSVLYPLLGFDPSGGRNIRSSILNAPESFESAPKYFAFLDSLWKKQVLKNKDDNDDNNSRKNNIFVSLQRDGVDQGKLRVTEGLAIIAQFLIGMTAANGLVSCLKRLVSTDKKNLIDFGRVVPSSTLSASSPLSTYRKPLSDDDIMNVFDSEESLNMFITEVLRVDAPLQRMPRRVVKDTILQHPSSKNKKFFFEKDDQLMLMIGCANFSSSSSSTVTKYNFPSYIRPYTNENDRATAAARSFTFGRGLHRCVGQKLTVMDIESGIEGFLRYFGKSEDGNNNNADTLVELRKKYTFELGEMLDDVDVGNYGHHVAKVVVVVK